MADWPMMYAQVAESDADTANSRGVRITTANDAKGSWVEAIASTSVTGEWLMVWALRNVAGPANEDFLFDIGVGAAGSEVVVVPDFSAAVRGSAHMTSPLMLPLRIPRGSRVAVRGQNSGTVTRDFDMHVQVIGGGFKQAPGFTRCENFGADTTDTGGVSVDPGGTAHTKGAWSQLVASTPFNVHWATLCLGNQLNSARSLADWLVDIGVGGAGSEGVIVPNLPIASEASQQVRPTFTTFPVAIPAGSRVVVRAQCSIIDATDRIFDAIMLGVG